jgi:hypothetical protein
VRDAIGADQIIRAIHHRWDGDTETEKRSERKRSEQQVRKSASLAREWDDDVEREGAIVIAHVWKVTSLERSRAPTSARWRRGM